jgi:hypothetical protein
MGAVTHFALAAGLAGCVDEYNVDVYAILPQIDNACLLLDAASLRLDVEPLDGARFAVTASPCESQLAGQNIAGFHVQLEELTAGYHRMTATVDDGDDAPVGAIALPFSAARPVTIPFARADLPMWPTATLAVSLTGCTGDAHLAGTLALAMDPSIVVALTCDSPAMIVAPRGPLALAVTADCATGTDQIEVVDDETVSIAMTRTCP